MDAQIGGRHIYISEKERSIVRCLKLKYNKYVHYMYIHIEAFLGSERSFSLKHIFSFFLKIKKTILATQSD